MVHIGTREYDRRFAFLEEITHPVAVHHRDAKCSLYDSIIIFIIILLYNNAAAVLFNGFCASSSLLSYSAMMALHKYDRRVADDDRGGPHSLSLHVYNTQQATFLDHELWVCT